MPSPDAHSALTLALVRAAFAVMHHDCDPDDPDDPGAQYERAQLTCLFRQILQGDAAARRRVLTRPAPKRRSAQKGKM